MCVFFGADFVCWIPASADERTHACVGGIWSLSNYRIRGISQVRFVLEIRHEKLNVNT